MAMKVTLLVRKKPWHNEQQQAAVHPRSSGFGEAEPGQERERRGVGAQHARPERHRHEAVTPTPRPSSAGAEPAFGAAQDDQTGSEAARGAAVAAARAGSAGGRLSTQRGARRRRPRPGAEPRVERAAGTPTFGHAACGRTARSPRPRRRASGRGAARRARRPGAAPSARRRAAGSRRRRARSPSRRARPCARWPACRARASRAAPARDRRSTAAPTRTPTAARPIRTIRACHSPPAPLKSVSGSPGCRRSTCTWRACAAGRSKASPAASGGRKMRGAIVGSCMTGTPPRSARRGAAAAHRPPDDASSAAQRRHDALLGRAPPLEHAREPGELHQLRLDQDEEPADERRAEHLGGDDEGDAERRPALLDQPERAELDRKQQHRRHEEERERDARRQPADRGFEARQRRPGRQPGDQGRERPPAEFLDEDDQRREASSAPQEPPAAPDDLHDEARRARRPAAAVRRRRASFAPRRPPLALALADLLDHALGDVAQLLDRRRPCRPPASA